jgi:hypothetical protein
MSRGKHKRKRENEAQKAQQANAAQIDGREAQTAKREEEMTPEKRSGTSSSKAGRWTELFVSLATVVGLATGVLSLFPHITVSDPVQMDATDLFSYQITSTNDGVLPIFDVKWAFAPRDIKVGVASDNQGHGVKLILPHYADWIITNELMASVTKPGTERHAAMVIEPGSEIIVSGPPDFEFHFRPADNSVGTVVPGDQFSVTTEGLMTAPPGVTYDIADFAIAITYIPVFPPIPMQTCAHFQIYKDRQGTPHWFRATNQCDRFPWMHNWFYKPPKPGQED